MGTGCFFSALGVVVEPGLVLGPDRLLGRLAGVGLGALDDDPHPAAVLVEEVLHVSGYAASPEVGTAP